MKTFSEMLNDHGRPFTQDMRDAVEAVLLEIADESTRAHAALNEYKVESETDFASIRCSRSFVNQVDDLLKEMRSTPPAKEPVDCLRLVAANAATGLVVYLPEEIFKPGDRVRVTKIEETK